MAALLGLTACSGGEPSAASGNEEQSAAPVQHKYGTTTVPAQAQRVVTVGYTDQEPVLALGVAPVGVVDFFGERPYGSWPWEKALWNGTVPAIVGERDEYQLEKIASLHPDLIIGLYSGMTQASYEALTRIAPTVAQPVGFADFAAPWTVQTDMAGRSLGRQPQAQKLVDDVNAQVTAARQAHPEWAGKTVAVVEPAATGEWAVFGAADPKLQFLEGLGFTVAPIVRQLEAGGDVAQLSTERLDLLEVDRLVLLIDPGDPTEAKVRANPLFSRLRVAREGRALFLPFSPAPSSGAAMAFNSVLSIPYGLQQVVPALAR
ncbi:iron-siderophore ABC transporter substrate-binding protein [Pseudonocardia phyllosphaerae]|uniref:iron-siderophore ABC transporter substrate-binding protein n=1 Tax=Pseudonocardia phyllosphaerae TaxID=3390502 RepID=UPI00397C2B80